MGLDGASVVGVVEDDGCGFEQVLVGGGGGLGLMGMRERAVGAGGQVTVQSELGRGTRVRLVIPLNNGDA